MSGMGFPNQFFNDSWVVGLWRADHGGHDVGLGRRAWALAQAVSGRLGKQGTAADVSTLRGGADRSWRSQERSADGGAACVTITGTSPRATFAGAAINPPLWTECLGPRRGWPRL